MATQIQMFLDLGAKAERHRQAAVKYKQMLRTFERLSPSAGQLPDLGSTGDLAKRLDELEQWLAETDGAAPVVPAGLARKVEARPVVIVKVADDLVARH